MEFQRIISEKMNYRAFWVILIIMGSLLFCSSCQANNQDKKISPPTTEKDKNLSAEKQQNQGESKPTTVEGTKNQSDPKQQDEDEDKPKWNAVCKLPEGSLTVEFNSPTSGDVTEDDMTVKVRWSDGSETPIPVKPGWYAEKSRFISEAKILCPKMVGYALPGKRLLLWFFCNDRPNGDQLQLALQQSQRKPSALAVG